MPGRLYEGQLIANAEYTAIGTSDDCCCGDECATNADCTGGAICCSGGCVAEPYCIKVEWLNFAVKAGDPTNVRVRKFNGSIGDTVTLTLTDVTSPTGAGSGGTSVSIPSEIKFSGNNAATITITLNQNFSFSGKKGAQATVVVNTVRTNLNTVVCDGKVAVSYTGQPTAQTKSEIALTDRGRATTTGSLSASKSEDIIYESSVGSKPTRSVVTLTRGSLSVSTVSKVIYLQQAVNDGNKARYTIPSSITCNSSGVGTFNIDAVSTTAINGTTTHTIYFYEYDPATVCLSSPANIGSVSITIKDVGQNLTFHQIYWNAAPMYEGGAARTLYLEVTPHVSGAGVSFTHYGTNITSSDFSSGIPISSHTFTSGIGQRQTISRSVAAAQNNDDGLGGNDDDADEVLYVVAKDVNDINNNTENGSAPLGIVIRNKPSTGEYGLLGKNCWTSWITCGLDGVPFYCNCCAQRSTDDTKCNCTGSGTGFGLTGTQRKTTSRLIFNYRNTTGSNKNFSTAWANSPTASTLLGSGACLCCRHSNTALTACDSPCHYASSRVSISAGPALGTAGGSASYSGGTLTVGPTPAAGGVAYVQFNLTSRPPNKNAHQSWSITDNRSSRPSGYVAAISIGVSIKTGSTNVNGVNCCSNGL
jgi:hypothetical protein